MATIATWRDGATDDKSGYGIFNMLNDTREIKFESFEDFNYLTNLVMKKMHDAAKSGREEVAKVVNDHVYK